MVASAERSPESGSAFGMDVIVFSRSKVEDPGILSLQGQGRPREGAARSRDVLVLALPHTKSTEKMIGEEELSMMKRDAILVNVARAELVDEAAIYNHLVANRGFIYATDVWWTRDGRGVLLTKTAVPRSSTTSWGRPMRPDRAPSPGGVL